MPVPIICSLAGQTSTIHASTQNKRVTQACSIRPMQPNEASRARYYQKAYPENLGEPKTTLMANIMSITSRIENGGGFTSARNARSNSVGPPYALRKHAVLPPLGHHFSIHG